MVISIVRHPEYGMGHVLEIRPDPLPACDCEQCKVSHRPSHFMLVKWLTDRGAAGGWYNPMDERFTFENAVAVANHLRGIEESKNDRHQTHHLPGS